MPAATVKGRNPAAPIPPDGSRTTFTVVVWLVVICTGTLSTEDEIRMLEAMKNQEKIQLNEIDRKIDELRKTVRE